MRTPCRIICSRQRGGSSNLRLPHKIRDGQTALARLISPWAHVRLPSDLESLAINRVLDQVHDLVDGIVLAAHAPGGFRVKGVNLDTSKVGVLAVLVVLEDLHLEDVGDESIAIGVAACAGNRDLLPTDWTLEGHGGEFDQVVFASSGFEDDFGRGVRFVFGVVDEEANVADADALDKVDGHAMRLGTIGSNKC